jgi:NAD(P)H-dependent FMN reductase
MIKILCASTGNNLKLSNELNTILKDLGQETEVLVLEDFNLPLYSSKMEEKGVPEEAIKLSNNLKEAKGFIVVAPEYNGTIPAMLNNAISWCSRAGDEDWRAAFNEKFAVAATHSGGGGTKVIASIKQMMEHLGCNTLARPIITNYQKSLNPDSAKTILASLIQAIK